MSFPTDLQAEQALLGTILTDGRMHARVAGILRGEHFSDPLHIEIYAAIARRVAAGEPADVITLKAEFEQCEALEQVGGTRYLAQLGVVADPADIEAIARRIVASWVCRRIIDLGERLVREAFANPASAVLATFLDNTGAELTVLRRAAAT